MVQSMLCVLHKRSACAISALSQGNKLAGATSWLQHAAQMPCYYMCSTHLHTRRMQVKLMGTRERAAELDFSAVALEEEVEAELKEAAVISMGTEISEADLLNIMALCDQARPHPPAAGRARGTCGTRPLCASGDLISQDVGDMSGTGRCARLRCRVLPQQNLSRYTPCKLALVGHFLGVLMYTDCCLG